MSCARTESTRARHGRVALALLCAALWSPRAVQSQGTVSGTVRILETGTLSTKDLADAVVFVDGDGVTVRPGSALDNPTVDMKGREFVPHVQIVRAGSGVAYPNKDPFSHNVFSNSALGAFDLGLYRTGASRAAPFARGGVYAVYCNIHARMVNFVVAVSTPYVARVNADGTFILRGVPAGTYKLHVWHERAPELVQPVVVTASGTESLTIALDARSYKPSAHLDKLGKPYATTRADRY
jgi:plastocyanin